MSLTFIQGTMASCKSALLLMFRNQLPTNSDAIKIATPVFEIEKTHIETRAPLDPQQIDFRIKEGNRSWVKAIDENVKFLLIDECQFLDIENIYRIKKLSKRVNVLCFGLVHDFQNHCFQGSSHLNKVADRIVKIPSVCTLCLENFAECNMRESNGKMVLEGPQLLSKSVVNYIPVCRVCYKLKRKEASKVN